MVNDISNDKQQKVNASIYDGKQDTHHEKNEKQITLKMMITV